MARFLGVLKEHGKAENQAARAHLGDAVPDQNRTVQLPDAKFSQNGPLVTLNAPWIELQLDLTAALPFNIAGDSRERFSPSATLRSLGGEFQPLSHRRGRANRHARNGDD